MLNVYPLIHILFLFPTEWLDFVTCFRGPTSTWRPILLLHQISWCIFVMFYLISLFPPSITGTWVWCKLISLCFWPHLDFLNLNLKCIFKKKINRSSFYIAFWVFPDLHRVYTTPLTLKSFEIHHSWLYAASGINPLSYNQLSSLHCN